MREDLKSVNWELELEGLDSIQTWNVIAKKLNAIFDTHVSKSKDNTTKSRRKPLWFNENAHHKVRKKKKCHDRYRQTLEGKDYCEYTWTRNQAKWACKKAIRYFEKLIVKEAKSNPKAFYNYVNSKAKTRLTVSDLINNRESTVASNDKEKADALNIFFSSVFTQEDLQNIPAFEDRCENFLSSVDLSDEAIMVNFKKLKHNKSPEPDGIHPRILKDLSEYLLVPLRILFTRSLSEGVLHNSWNISHVISIFKGGKRSCASNYRPVSLTCIICKMLELLIWDAIFKHLIDNNLLVECQHGFIQGRSCVTQLLKIMDTWTEMLDEGDNVDVAYLDYRKALIVCHMRDF